MRHLLTYVIWFQISLVFLDTLEYILVVLWNIYIALELKDLISQSNTNTVIVHFKDISFIYLFLIYLF